MSWDFILKTSYRDPLANSSIHCGHLLFVLLQRELHKKRCLQNRKVWRMCSVFDCFEFFLTAHVCMLRVCPYDDLPSAAWTAPPLGRRDTEILPGWRSPRAAPRTTSCRQKQTGVSLFCTTECFPRIPSGLNRESSGTWYSHITLVCVYPVKQSLGSHPLDW